MPGNGTRTGISNASPPARCLDLTRLISRVGRGPATGVDRVEAAYLCHLLQVKTPLFALVRTVLGYVLLDRNGAAEIAARLNGEHPWGGKDLIGTLSRRISREKARAEADLRRLAIARCRRGALGGMLSRHLPEGTVYLNVGHSNLGPEVLSAWGAVPGALRVVLIHDTIPLDHPEFQRPGTPAAFESKLRRVGAGVDLVIYNSRATREAAERRFKAWGRTPEGLVAHLGVDLPKPEPDRIPPDLRLTAPYFITLGTIEPRKNHGHLLDVWEVMADSLKADAMPHLIIAGRRGWENAEVFERLNTSPVMNRFVHEREGLDDGAVAALIGNAAALLFPSRAEGFGLPPLEATALGTPVICSDLPIYREFLGNIPVYLDSDDVYSWQQSIMRLADEEQAGQASGAHAAAAPRLPTWTDHFNLVLKVA